jgi:hypothetical protein
MNNKLINFSKIHNCKNCFYYKKGVCNNLNSPLSYEDVKGDDKCKEWNEKKKETIKI